MSTIALLIFHGLVSVALLGAVTHQLVAVLRPATAAPTGNVARRSSFLRRYARVGPDAFTAAVALLYIASVTLGAVIYPAYRIDVRIPFEEMSLYWAVGLFEIKEHWGGIGLGLLPLYLHTQRRRDEAPNRVDRIVVIALLALIVWTDFVVGHFLNNIRGL